VCEDDALGVTGRAAGKYNSRNVIKRGGAIAAANFAMAFAGKRLAANAAATRSPKPASLATSSMKIVSPGAGF